MMPVSNPDNTTQELPLNLAATDVRSNCRSTTTSQRTVETNQHHNIFEKRVTLHYAWGVTFLVHQFESLGSSDRKTSISGFFPFLQVWTYLHLPGLRRGTLERPGLVPLARHWVLCRDTHPLEEQLASIQDAIDIYPQLDVVWQPYLEEGDEGQLWLEQARPYFGRTREWAREQIEDWEHRGRRVRSDAKSEDAYLQAFALKYGARVYRGARRQTWPGRAQTDASSSRAASEAPQSDLEDRLAGATRRAEEAQVELAERVTELRTTTDRAAHLQKQVYAATSSVAQWRLQAETAVAERDQLHTQAGPSLAEVTRWRAEAETSAVEVARWRIQVEVVVAQGSLVDPTELARLRIDLAVQQSLVVELRSYMEMESEPGWSERGKWCLGQAVFGRFLQSTEERGGGEVLSRRDER
ncbi:hypothetical protein Taro_041083 [Colocasia esculenta]|uniref:Aminotransferase-like plant mobile domain-containing protein n=1 Tax=Colocasia esculenta TaxID=4460 RepID=A0A843WNS6_COLES|nr:hypothetical protein [Colocasia esculenta]